MSRYGSKTQSARDFRAEYKALAAKLTEIEKATDADRANGHYAYLHDECVDSENAEVEEGAPDYWKKMLSSAEMAALNRAEDQGIDLAKHGIEL